MYKELLPSERENYTHLSMLSDLGDMIQSPPTVDKRKSQMIKNMQSIVGSTFYSSYLIVW